VNWVEILNQVFQLVLVPLLGIITTWFVKWINSKIENQKVTTENELYRKYLTMFQDTVERSVTMTNQTYVDALKNKNAFTAEAQKEAFEMTYKQVISLMTDEAKNYLSNVVGDFDEFTKMYIESIVNGKKADKVG
jgi:high-affinity Fe2+/Pb2+ permease